MPGGVEFSTDAAGLAWINLYSRVASRIVVRVASFTATGFPELEKQARRVPWERWLANGATVALTVSCRKSKLYHSGAVEERVAGVLARELGAVSLRALPEVDDAETGESKTSAEVVAPENSGESQRVLVRLYRDRVTLSVDSSGELLHRRGYRQAVAKAPLRETLAAAMVIASNWKGDRPLVDPFCGSGTICIEAALLARNIPPGRHRNFAMEAWPEMPTSVVADARSRSEDAVSTAALPSLVGTDRDEGAITAARENAERAGVAADIDFSRKTVSVVKAPTGPTGSLLTNPPYGVRVGEARALRDLYARVGDVLRSEFAGWHVGLLVPHRGLIEQLRLGHEWRLDTTNGGIRVGLAYATLSARGPAVNYR